MTSTTYRNVGIAFAALIVLVGGGFWLSRLVWQDATTGDQQPPPLPTTTPAPPTPTLQQRLSERLQGVTLRTSDAVVRELVGELSSHPTLASWLVNDDLVRRFVATTRNVAEGKSPRSHLEFMVPDEPFQVSERAGGVYIDPATYRRYDLATEVFTSLDVPGTVRLYRELEPLIDEAYREIAPPGASFATTLDTAIDELLAVPVVEGAVEVAPKVLTYTYAEPRLERLSPAQRLLLRTGPDNVRRIQATLRELQVALRE
jgi:hypothetical protein